MPNPYGVPEITAQTLHEKFTDGEPIVLMDVREPHELQYAKLPDEWVTLVPLSKLAREYLNGLPESVQAKETEIVVMCHTGQRSAQVTAWLIQNGWTNVYNLLGGIDAYARTIDPSVGFY
ncbi:MAG TPA: rhodanese-like domain-containing protein [Anaerolineales bacterium]|nr:rhodanese-like domain-containing protein [Anaerolineales bacterium]